MGACATKSGDLKVKGEAPLVVEDAAAPPVASDEKAKAQADAVPVATEVDQADVSRRRSLSVLLKQDAEASDGEAAYQEAEKVVAGELASAAGDAGETVGSPQAPVQAASVAAEQDDTAEEVQKDDPNGDGDAQAAEEEKRVDPESVQVAGAVTAAAAAAAPSSEKSKVADDDASASA